jgi:hypothetical protein
MSKARLIHLLVIAAIFAYFLALANPFGMSDGGGFAAF